MLYYTGESQHTQYIQINKVIDENGICVFYFMEKSKWTFLWARRISVVYKPHTRCLLNPAFGKLFVTNLSEPTSTLLQLCAFHSTPGLTYWTASLCSVLTGCHQQWLASLTQSNQWHFCLTLKCSPSSCIKVTLYMAWNSGIFLPLIMCPVQL